eukprot:5220420-Pyramimonas_sp.AAC.1
MSTGIEGTDMRRERSAWPAGEDKARESVTINMTSFYRSSCPDNGKGACTQHPQETLKGKRYNQYLCNNSLGV